ncbi:substrate-binding domain-containing protein [Sphingomonas bacterium]|uniref:substrate-binding domain-containing protein n=1 Tax=Sphingomonas bacterium TaxID=1895847 RepID=UPI001576E6BD|nr:substrate-binding domain-containing protein [Sphingomonas bacterium]
MHADITRRTLLTATGALGLASCARRTGTLIAFVPKFTSDPYFLSANQGAQEAAREVGVNVLYNGPVDANVAGQVDIVDRLIRNRVDAISICALDPDALTPSLRRAQARGIAVNCWDADVRPEGRQVFLNQATYPAIGEAIADIMARHAGTSGEFLMLVGSLTASNMLAWQAAIQETIARKYPGMRIKTTLLGEQDIEKGKNVTLNYLRANPDIRGVFTNDGGATVSAAEAVMQLGRPPGTITIAGIGVPNGIRPYVRQSVIREAVLWSPIDIGYAAIRISKAQLERRIDPASCILQAGRLGALRFTSPDTLLLGPPLIFSAANIDRFNF